MRRGAALALFLFLLFGTVSADADRYWRYVDAEGNLGLTDDPARIPPAAREVTVVERESPAREEASGTSVGGRLSRQLDRRLDRWLGSGPATAPPASGARTVRLHPGSTFDPAARDSTLAPGGRHAGPPAELDWAGLRVELRQRTSRERVVLLLVASWTSGFFFVVLAGLIGAAVVAAVWRLSHLERRAARRRLWRAAVTGGWLLLLLLLAPPTWRRFVEHLAVFVAELGPPPA